MSITESKAFRRAQYEYDTREEPCEDYRREMEIEQTAERIWHTDQLLLGVVADVLVDSGLIEIPKGATVAQWERLSREHFKDLTHALIGAKLRLDNVKGVADRQPCDALADEMIRLFHPAVWLAAEQLVEDGE